MNKFRKFLGMLEDEVDIWQYSEELRDLFHELCKEHSGGEYSPERIREKIKKERDEIVRSKNLLCPNCVKSSKRFTPEGLFNHFITTHKDQTEFNFKSNPKQVEREDYGIMLGKISLDRINAEQDVVEKNHMWKYLVEKILPTHWSKGRSCHKMYVDLCEKKFGRIQNYSMDLIDKFTMDEVFQLFYLAEENEEEYQEEVKRNGFIEQIINHFSDGINSVKHFSETATQRYATFYFNNFPKSDSVENPNEYILSKFSTNELTCIISNFNGKIR